MASLFGLFRVGNEPVIRYTQKGDAVLGLSLAYNYGRKGDDGKKPTQWVDGSLWGKQAEALAPYIGKGGLVVCSLDDVHIEEYEGKNGQGHKLVGRISGFEFAGGKSEQKQAAQAKAAPANEAQGFDGMEDNIPFAFNMNTVCDTMGAPIGLMRSRHGKRMLLLQANKADC